MPLTPCELHIPMGNSIVVVAQGIVSPMDPDKTPRSHGNPIPPGYYSVSVDRVIKYYRELALDFPEGDGEKTLGQVEHSFILWHKRYIIIPGAAARVLCLLLNYLIIGADESQRNSFSIIFNWPIVNNPFLSLIFVLTGPQLKSRCSISRS